MNDSFVESQIEDARRFRFERVARIIEKRTALRLHLGLHTILHVIPLSPPNVAHRFESNVFDLHKQGRLQPLFTSTAFNSVVNAEGCLIHGRLTASGTVGSYLQVFRRSALESVNTQARLDPSVHQKRILSLELELQLLRVLPQYFAGLEALGARPPVILGLTMIGVEGYSMEVPLSDASAFANSFDRRISSDTLFLPDVVAETFEGDLGQLLKPVFDVLWRASGWEGSIFYNNSEWVGLAKAFAIKTVGGQ